MLGDSVAYRDRRNEGMDEYVKPAFPSRNYTALRNSKQQFNTIISLPRLKENPNT